MSSPTARAAPKQAQSKVEDGDGEILDISGQDIDTLTNLGYLVSPQTKTLNISNNKLSSLNELLPMFQLLEFDASYNMIVDIDTVLPFPKLQTLNLSHNRIVRLACTIPTSLRSIDISYNNIYSMDFIAPVLSLKALESLDIRGNPLAKQIAYHDIISNFPQLKTFNGRSVQDLSSSINTQDELTLSELTDRNNQSATSTLRTKRLSSAMHDHDAPSSTITQKAKQKLVIDEQVILFSRSGASSSHSSRPHTAATKHTLSNNLANESVAKPTPFPPASTPQQPSNPSQPDNHQIVVEQLQSDPQLEPKQLVDQATMPDHQPTYTTTESQTDMSYKDVRQRTIYDFSDEEDDTTVSIYNAPDANEAKRMRRIKALLKNSEQVVDSTYIHTLEGQIQGYKQNEEQLRNEIEALEQQLERLKTSNVVLQSAVRPVETVPPVERRDFMLSNQIDEVVFLREQVKILDDMLNRQEAASAVQFPVPEAIPEYLHTLNTYRRKLFHTMFDLRQLKQAKESIDVSCLIAPAVDDIRGPMLRMETDMAQITEEKNQLSEEHAEVLRKLTMTEHAARAFHEEVTKYSSILSSIHASLEADSKAEKLDGLDEGMAKRISVYMNTSKAPSLDDAQKYILAASESASYRLAAQCSAIEAVMDRINDILSENQVVKGEREQLHRELIALTRERNELKDDNFLLRDTLRQQREEKARLEELKASGYLDKAISCTEVDLGEIVHGSTQTYLEEFLTHVETQANPQEFLISKSIQIVREMFNVDGETQTGNLREMTDYNNSLLDVLPSSTQISVEHVKDIKADEEDEEYKRLIQMKDIHDRSKGTDCTIIPSSILLKLHIDTSDGDTSESTLDAAIRSLLSVQSNGFRREGSLGDDDIKMDKTEKVHTGVQIETPLPAFKAIQCELLRSTGSAHDMLLSSRDSMNGTGDNPHIPRYRSNSEGCESDPGSVEDTMTMVFASTQADAPDMKYFGIQTDEVDVAPYGTLAALQTQTVDSGEKPIILLDTKIASTQCEQITVAFKLIQWPDNEAYAASRGDSLIDDTININGSAQSDKSIKIDGAASEDADIHNSTHAHASHSKEYKDDGSMQTKVTPEQLKDSPYISRLHSPPQSPYLRAIEYEQYCDVLVERLNQQAQELAARELELEDMNEVVSDVMKTINSAENKVSDYKRRLRESQSTISTLQSTVTQLQGSLAAAEAKEVEHAARIKLLEELLGTEEDAEKCIDEEIQTRINLADMRLLFAQMRVATSSVSTQYKAPLNVLRDHKEALDASVIVHNLSGESIKRSIVSRSNSVTRKYKSDELQVSQFEPAIIPLTPPLSSSSNSDREESLETSFRNSPFVTVRISATEGVHGKGNTVVSVFHPSTSVLQKSTELLEKSSVTTQLIRPPREEPETRVRFFCRSNDRKL